MEPSFPHIDHIIVLAGLSGAGKSTALKVFSDVGCYTVDNLPVALLPNFLQLSDSQPGRLRRITLLLDIGSAAKVQEFLQFLDQTTCIRERIKLVFLDAATPSLIRRYSETRRPHPGFDPVEDKTLKDTIQREREMLIPLKERAQVVIDTTEDTVHDLKRELHAFWCSLGDTPPSTMRVNFLSFGFKNGIPLDCDLVVDVRFLPNPHFVQGLREYSGLDAPVVNYLEQMADTGLFIEQYITLLRFLLPRYSYEGKAYLNIGVGCTGGKHRSVYIAEKLYLALGEVPIEMTGNVAVSVKHRDLGRE